jgi:hypothetical protein
MTGPPAERLHSDTVSRGSREKQPRAFDGGGRVRVVGEDDILLDICAPDGLGRYLGALNAEVKRRKDGSIRLVRLRSRGDDRGHLGECHGSSAVTTERVRSDLGLLVGGDCNLKHKATCSAWGRPAVEIRTEEPGERGAVAASTALARGRG